MKKEKSKKKYSKNKDDKWCKDVMDDLMKNKMKEVECECCSHHEH